MYQDSDFITPTYTYQIDTNDVVIQASSKMQVLIYRRTAARPSMMRSSRPATAWGCFSPYSSTYRQPDAITLVQWGHLRGIEKALRRAGGASYIEILDKVQENPNLADIDYAYVAFGVALNAQENSCRRYIYEFSRKQC